MEHINQYLNGPEYMSEEEMKQIEAERKEAQEEVNLSVENMRPYSAIPSIVMNAWSAISMGLLAIAQMNSQNYIDRDIIDKVFLWVRIVSVLLAMSYFLVEAIHPRTTAIEKRPVNTKYIFFYAGAFAVLLPYAALIYYSLSAPTFGKYIFFLLQGANTRKTERFDMLWNINFLNVLALIFVYLIEFAICIQAKIRFGWDHQSEETRTGRLLKVYKKGLLASWAMICLVAGVTLGIVYLLDRESLISGFNFWINTIVPRINSQFRTWKYMLSRLGLLKAPPEIVTLKPITLPQIPLNTSMLNNTAESVGNLTINGTSS